MRIAVLFDIHGNPTMLDAVLGDIQTQGVDLTVSLGDIASGPLRSREAVDQLMVLNLSTIRGNHERQALADDPLRMGALDQYMLEQLRPDQLAWFVNLSVLRHIDNDVLFVHGPAQGDQTYFLGSLSENRCRAAMHDEVLYRVEDVDAKLVLCGCMHMPRAVELADGCFIVNPGSVDLQAYSDAYPSAHTIGAGSSHTRYAVVTEHVGEWAAELRVVEHVWNDVAAIAGQRGRQDWAAVLRAGRVQA